MLIAEGPGRRLGHPGRLPVSHRDDSRRPVHYRGERVWLYPWIADLGPGEDVIVSAFTDGASPDTSNVTYEVRGSIAADHFDIAFFASGDDRYHRDEDQDLGFWVTVSPASIQDDPNLDLLSESPGHALKTGKHTLVIRGRGTGLAEGLENPRVETVLAVADPPAT